MDHKPHFVGRSPELEHWERVLADPRGQAVLVVGHQGMGKTLLVNEMARIACVHAKLTCGSVRYEVTASDDVSTTMALIMDHAFEAANVTEKSLDATRHRLGQWRAILNIINIGDLLMSLRRDPQRNTRDQFIERLQLISDRMPNEGRVVFVIDARPYMQANSDQDWALVVEKLPRKIKILFAQRPDDVLACSEAFSGLTDEKQVIRIPQKGLGVLDEPAVYKMIDIRATELKRNKLVLRQALSKYKQHPYEVSAALKLIATGTAIEDLPSHSDDIAPAQWSQIKQGGATRALGDKAVALFQAYAVLEVPVPDDVVEVVANVTSAERTALMGDNYLGSLIWKEGEQRYIYHDILAHHIRKEMREEEAEPYHRRATEEFRKRLRHPRQENAAPDLLSALRLAVHARKVENPLTFATTLVDDCARQLFKLGLHAEVGVQLNTGLEVLKIQADTPERARQELNVLLALGPALMATKGQETTEVKRIYTRARKLSKQVRETPQSFRAMGGLWRFYFASGELKTARKLGERFLRSAQRKDDRALMLAGHWMFGTASFWSGDVAVARSELENSIALYDPKQHHDLSLSYGLDPGSASLAYAALALWVLGYPDQALQRSQEALTLAKELSHPFSLAYAHALIAIFHQFCRNGPAAYERAEACLTLSTEHDFPIWIRLVKFPRGWALTERGERAEGMSQMQQGLKSWSKGSELLMPHYLALLAEAHGKVGQVKEGLALLAEGLRMVDKNGERLWEAELHRLKGDLFLNQVVPDEAQAETCFHRALDIARRQQARLLELRAAVSLSLLWLSQDKPDEARRSLAEAYDWFTEGLKTADLEEAKALLDKLV